MKILIVEDNADLRKSMKESLVSRFPLVNLTEAEDGRQAIERISAQSPDLIFVDIHLPDTNGLELTRRIKAQHPGVVVVILTTDDFPEYREAARRFGARAFFTKDSMDWGEIATLISSLVSAKDSREGKA